MQSHCIGKNKRLKTKHLQRNPQHLPQITLNLLKSIKTLCSTGIQLQKQPEKL